MHSVWGLISLLYWHSQESSPLYKTASGHQEHDLHACLYIRVFCHLCVCVLLFAVAFLVAIGNTLTFFYKNMPLLQVHPWSQLSGFTVLADCLTLELVPSFTTLVGLQTGHKSRDFGFVAAYVTSSGRICDKQWPQLFAVCILSQLLYLHTLHILEAPTQCFAMVSCVSCLCLYARQSVI